MEKTENKEELKMNLIMLFLKAAFIAAMIIPSLKK